jgi:hypothetical protein
MFVGHYGISYASKRAAPALPLWVLFLAVQWLDVVWSPLVLLGIEKVRIVPGFTATNPLDLYYMPYTHSLVAALVWSAAILLIYKLVVRSADAWRNAIILGLAVFSHWVLDLIVHRADLPLYGNSAKVGFGLWDHRALAFGAEAAVLFGGMWLYLRTAPVRRLPMVVFGLVMLGVQAYIFFGPPPASSSAIAWTALVAYAVFALVAARLERPAGQAGQADIEPSTS